MHPKYSSGTPLSLGGKPTRLSPGQPGCHGRQRPGLASHSPEARRCVWLCSHHVCACLLVLGTAIHTLEDCIHKSGFLASLRKIWHRWAPFACGSTWRAGVSRFLLLPNLTRLVVVGVSVIHLLLFILGFLVRSTGLRDVPTPSNVLSAPSSNPALTPPQSVGVRGGPVETGPPASSSSGRSHLRLCDKNHLLLASAGLFPWSGIPSCLFPVFTDPFLIF